MKTGKELELFTSYVSDITSVAFNLDEMSFAFASFDGTVSFVRLNFTLPPDQQEEAYALFKEKGFNFILKEPLEESQSS